MGDKVLLLAAIVAGILAAAYFVKPDARLIAAAVVVLAVGIGWSVL